MINEISKLPVFTVFLTLIVWELSLIVSTRTKKAYMNPLLISIVTICILLTILRINISNYLVGGNMINYFLGPATVVLAIPLFRQLHLLKRHSIAIITSTVVGVITSLISVTLLCKILNVDQSIFLSLLPKSITTAVGIEVSKQIGGIPGISVVGIIVTGITGAIIAQSTLLFGGIKNSVAKGIAIGTSSHAVGTSKAMEMGEVEGAFSGLAIGLAGVTTSLILPFILSFLTWLFLLK